MADDNIDIRVKIREAAQAARDAMKVAHSVHEIGDQAAKTERKTHRAGRAFEYMNARMRLTRGLSIGAGAGLVGVAGAAGAAGVAVGGLAYVVGKKSIAAWNESRKIAAQTAAVLKSTGGVANVTAAGVSNLATAISKKTGIDDEAIQSTENLLLTFTSLRNETGAGNDIFNQATQAVTDMSVALGQDGKSSAIQLGKALQDPVTGMTALRRVGVNFTKDQAKTVGGWVKHGQTLRAQKFILREVTKEFGGSAQAQATAGDKMRVSIGNVEEAIGSGLVPVTDAAAKQLTHLADHVLPYVTKAGQDVSREFSGSGSFGVKLQRAGRDAGRDLRPLARQIGDVWRHAHVGERASEAFTAAAPVVLDAAAKGGRAAAGAFLHAWWHAPLWEKLLTGAFIAKKVGAVGALPGLLGKAGGGGGVGGLLSSRGSTPANPLFVAPVGGKFPGGGKLPGAIPAGGPVVAGSAAAAGAAVGYNKAVPERGRDKSGAFQTTAGVRDPTPVAKAIRHLLGMGDGDGPHGTISLRPRATPPGGTRTRPGSGGIDVKTSGPSRARTRGLVIATTTTPVAVDGKVLTNVVAEHTLRRRER